MLLQKMGFEKKPEDPNEEITLNEHRESVFKYQTFYGLKPTG